ncbi:DNRLRE domain-containing protein, partial [Mesorhizobium sp. M00.F.Ca.ET.186.01.1.1]
MPVVTLTKANSVVRDTYLDENFPTTPQFGEMNLLVGASAGKKKRALIYIDLGLVPNNVTINTATLKIYRSGTASTETITFHKVTNNWGDVAAWNTAPTFDASATATVTSSTTGAYQSVSVKNIVQEWVNGTSPNYGLLLKGNEAVQDSLVNFVSFDHSAGAAYYAELIIDYTIPTTGKKQVEYVGSQQSLAQSAVSSFSPALPTGFRQGDLLLAAVHTPSSGYAISAPIGWTKIQESPAGGIRVSFWYKFAGTSETTPAFTATVGIQWLGFISAFRNVKAVRETTWNTYTSSTGSFSPPSSSTLYDKVLAVLLNATTNGSSVGYPSFNFNEIVDYASSTIGLMTQSSISYLHNKKTLTSAEMLTSISPKSE